MAERSKIEWTDATWNPVVGCSIISAGCTNCYAMAQAARIARMTLKSHYAGTTKTVNGNAVWTGVLRHAPERILLAPLRWKKPRRIFVNSMSDLFHESISDKWIDNVFAVMALCPQHDFLILTKRPKRMREYVSTLGNFWVLTLSMAIADAGLQKWSDRPGRSIPKWPLPNVWLGVTAENQETADARIPDLLATPAAVRFVSCEPLLGLADLGPYLSPYFQSECVEYPKLGELDWVIAGGESGPHARPSHPDWFRSIRDQCAIAGVSFFMKQMLIHGKLSKDIETFPEDMRVREFPQ